MTILLITLATIISTILGGLFAIKYKDKLHLILGFSAGTILGVAIFELLPETIELTEGVYDFMIIPILIAFGFSVYMLLDRFFSLHGKCEHDCENPAHNGKLGAVALIFHSFLDGFGIGLAFKVSPTIGWVVALSVLTHKFSDGINTVGMIIRNKEDIKKSTNWLAYVSLAPALGVAMAYFITITESTLGLILAVFIGFFLYLSASDLIPESHHHHPTIWTSLMTVIGLIVVYCATLLG